MSEVGEIVRGQTINKHCTTYYQWLPCESCGKLRWVALLKGTPRKRNRCISCSKKTPPYMNYSNPQIGDLAKGWQVGKKTSQWYKYVACSDCGTPIWKIFINNKVYSFRCLLCAHNALRKVRIPLMTPPNEGDIYNGLEIGKRCSKKYIWRICPICKNGRWVLWSDIKRLLSHKCRHCAGMKGNKNHRWKGGLTTTSGGYRLLTIYKNDPYYSMAANKKDGVGFILEHRFVMARHLGRCLHSTEIVHHKNGIKDDNRIENLELTILGVHSLKHSLGYSDGYKQGYQDGQSIKMLELLNHIKLLEWQLKETGIIPKNP